MITKEEAKAELERRRQEREQTSSIFSKSTFLPSNDQLDKATAELQSPEGLKNYINQIGLSMTGAPEFQAAAKLAPKILPKILPASITDKLSNLTGVPKYIQDYLATIGKGAGYGAASNIALNNDQNQSTFDKGLQGALNGAESGALLGSTLPLLTHSNPLVRIPAAGLAGGAAGYGASLATGHPALASGVGAGLGALLGSQFGGMHNAAVLNTLGQHTPEQLQAAVERSKAGTESGVPLNMFEALGTPQAGAALKNLGATKASSNLMYDFGEKRGQLEKDAIQKLYDTISPPEQEATESAKYMQALEQNPKVDIDPVIAEIKRLLPHTKMGVTKTLESTLDYLKPSKYSNLYGQQEYDNYLQGLHDTKEHFDDLIYGGPEAKNSVSKKEKGMLTSINNALKNQLDIASPGYEEARQIAANRFTKESIQKPLSQLSLEVNAPNFYSKILRNEDNYKNLYKRVGDATNPKGTESPAQTQLRLFKETFPYIIEPITAKVAAQQAEKGIPKIPGMVDALKNLSNDALFGQYNKAVARLATNPNWHQEIEKIDKMKKGPEKAFNFANLLTKYKAIAEASNSNR